MLHALLNFLIMPFRSSSSLLRHSSYPRLNEILLMPIKRDPGLPPKHLSRYGKRTVKDTIDNKVGVVLNLDLVLPPLITDRIKFNYI